MSVAVECWENERWFPGRGWGSLPRLPTDRPHWTDKKGSAILCRDGFLLPAGWRWDGDWFPVPNGGDGPDGWFYAVDYTIPTRFCSAKQSVTSMVRRRCWRRARVLTLPLDAAATLPHAREQLFYGFGNASENTADAVQYAVCQQKSAAAFALDVAAARGAVAAEDRGERSSAVSLRGGRRRDVYLLGFAQSQRGTMWLLLSGAAEKRRCSAGYYAGLRAQVESNAEELTNPKHEINIDVLRTLPAHELFANGDGVGSRRLRALLFCLHAHDKNLPYFQAFSYLGSLVILNVDDDDDAFWLMTCLVCDGGICPEGYYSRNRLDRDLDVIKQLCADVLDAKVVAHLGDANIDVTFFANGWLQAMMSAHLPAATACRVLDIIFAESSNSIVLRILVTFLRMHSRALLQMQDSGTMGQFANTWSRGLWDPSSLMSRLADDAGGMREHVESLRQRSFNAAE